ncbi:hypothetical protein E1218_03270 [Kribbella turkmenica]|uniref:Tetracyclin repressor-like C-terminal domain-containing protein n=1 Tax=Kribbella turkmenica TaxID=2530375 RepID=A0A4V2YH89_9ACTN|nr:hypothetical protein [Kribbella turkmenica]TDD29797.1 hypothetical protein E1218_03270 [Kribbella turkmenica]
MSGQEDTCQFLGRPPQPGVGLGVQGALGRVGVEIASRFISNASMLAGAIWTHSHPTPAIQAAYEADPTLTAIRLDFEPSFRDSLTTLLHGLLPRRNQTCLV